ncbi:unnamed protein product [Acanthoscelides obtectus]|uniref:Uncharacterized protein n=1 Tax=Acanthoscelides obtectus TaxID=200917 RepID=A0A9P0K3K3_ACAOB|nr:unnamed protein product [Acanthoscelides obtectus]CAK1652330.1 hypothetical protein AOBTE_LOCUS17788 [Acanthoscelides obtectus]
MVCDSDGYTGNPAPAPNRTDSKSNANDGKREILLEPVKELMNVKIVQEETQIQQLMEIKKKTTQITALYDRIQ